MDPHCTLTAAHKPVSTLTSMDYPVLLQSPGRRWDNEETDVLEVKSIKQAMRSVTPSHFTIHVPEARGASLQGEAVRQRHGRKWDEK